MRAKKSSVGMSGRLQPLNWMLAYIKFAASSTLSTSMSAVPSLYQAKWYLPMDTAKAKDGMALAFSLNSWISALMYGKSACCFLVFEP